MLIFLIRNIFLQFICITLKNNLLTLTTVLSIFLSIVGLVRTVSFLRQLESVSKNYTSITYFINPRDFKITYLENSNLLKIEKDNQSLDLTAENTENFSTIFGFSDKLSSENAKQILLPKCSYIGLVFSDSKFNNIICEN